MSILAESPHRRVVAAPERTTAGTSSPALAEVERPTTTTGVHNPTEKGYTAGQSTAEGGGYAWWRESVARQKAGYSVAGLDGRPKHCGTVPMLGESVALSLVGKGIRVSGMWRCGSRWCPECRAKVAHHKAEEVAQGVRWATGRGLVVVMFTLTGSHVTTEELERAGGSLHEAVQGVTTKTVRQRMSRAWALATKGRRAKALRAGRVGTITAQEVTVDDVMVSGSLTGIHWHRHLLAFLEPEVGRSALEVANDYGDMLFGYWQAGAESVGLRADRKGFDVTVAGSAAEAEELAGYVAKGESAPTETYADGVHLEMTRAEGKTGRGGGRVSPEQVLRNVAYLSEHEAGGRRVKRLVAQWRDLEEGTKGTHWLRWSPGLRDLVGLEEEQTDEEIANTEELVAEEVAVVSWEELREHVEELRRVVRDAADGEEWATLLICLESLGIDYYVVSAEEWQKRVSARLRAIRSGA